MLMWRQLAFSPQSPHPTLTPRVLSGASVKGAGLRGNRGGEWARNRNGMSKRKREWLVKLPKNASNTYSHAAFEVNFFPLGELFWQVVWPSWIPISWWILTSESSATDIFPLCVPGLWAGWFLQLWKSKEFTILRWNGDGDTLNFCVV